MKLYTQDRLRIMEMPGDIWTTVAGDKWIIVTNNTRAPQIAEYSDQERAAEVLAEIFKYYRNGKNSYILPKN